MAMAVTTRGCIVERCTARQLVVASATNVCLPSFSLCRSNLHDLSRALSRSCSVKYKRLDETDLLVRYVRGISPGVSSYRSRRIVPGQEIPRPPRSRPDAASRK